MAICDDLNICDLDYSSTGLLDHFNKNDKDIKTSVEVVDYENRIISIYLYLDWGNNVFYKIGDNGALEYLYRDEQSFGNYYRLVPRLGLVGFSSEDGYQYIYSEIQTGCPIYVPIEWEPESDQTVCQNRLDCVEFDGRVVLIKYDKKCARLTPVKGCGSELQLDHRIMPASRTTIKAVRNILQYFPNCLIDIICEYIFRLDYNNNPCTICKR